MTAIEKKISIKKIAEMIIFLIPIIVILKMYSTCISGNDFWWHLKVGQRVVVDRNVPLKDIFSWYGMERKINWTAHEWLAEVIFYVVFRKFGEKGIFIFSITSVIGMYILLWNIVRKYLDNNYFFSLIYLIFYSILSKFFFYGRPQVFGFFLLFFELKCLYDFIENENSKKIYFLPLISILWSNLHGGSAGLSYVVCIIFIIAGAKKNDFGRIEAKRLSNKSLAKLIIVTFAVILGLLVNPIGTKVLIYPYINLSDEISMRMISEWRSPDAKQLADIIFYFLPVAVMSYGVIEKKCKVRLIDVLIMCCFLLLFFRSVRFIMLWFIAASFYSFGYMPRLEIKAVTKLYEKVTIGILFVLVVFGLFIAGSNVIKLYNNGELIAKAMSDEAVKTIVEDSPNRLFNDYNFGETLIYNDIPVFFDSRADLFSQENILADGISLMLLSQKNGDSDKEYVDVNELIQKYNFDAILIKKSRPLYTYIISHTEKFMLIYEDEQLGYFKIRY